MRFMKIEKTFFLFFSDGLIIFYHIKKKNLGGKINFGRGKNPTPAYTTEAKLYNVGIKKKLKM